MTQTSEARRVVQETIRELGGIDIVVSNAVSLKSIHPSIRHRKTGSEVSLRGKGDADEGMLGMDAVFRLEGFGFYE